MGLRQGSLRCDESLADRVLCPPNSRGTRDLNFYQISQIKRVRVVRRADGYYAQFCVDTEREIKHEHTGKIVGIDL